MKSKALKRGRNRHELKLFCSMPERLEGSRVLTIIAIHASNREKAWPAEKESTKTKTRLFRPDPPEIVSPKGGYKLSNKTPSTAIRGYFEKKLSQEVTNDMVPNSSDKKNLS